MNSIEIISLIKDIVISGGAITGSIVAIKGLNTWQRQLKGQLEYELSRRILVTLFKYRDAINGVRNPAIWSSEIPTPPEDEARAMSREELSFYGESKAYQARWDKVKKERLSLYADLLEAEVIWGSELKNLFEKLYLLEHELFIKIHNHITLIDPKIDADYREIKRRIDRKTRDIMYDDLREKPDEFKKDLIDAITDIEKYLKPKLTHRKIIKNHVK